MTEKKRSEHINSDRFAFCIAFLIADLLAGIVTIPEDAVTVILTFLKLIFRLCPAEHFTTGRAATGMNRHTFLPAGFLLLRCEIRHIRHPVLGTANHNY